MREQIKSIFTTAWLESVALELNTLRIFDLKRILIYHSSLLNTTWCRLRRIFYRTNFAADAIGMGANIRLFCFSFGNSQSSALLIFIDLLLHCSQRPLGKCTSQMLRADKKLHVTLLLQTLTRMKRLGAWCSASVMNNLTSLFKYTQSLI